MESYDALVQHFGAPLAALIGATIGGIFTLKATSKTMRLENEKELKREEKEVQNMLGAIGVEINALWSFHMRRIGQMIEDLPDGKPLEFFYPLTQDYFTIYHANAHMIGRVKDPELREVIVVCYNKCKKVVDGFKYNNELFRDYRNATLVEDETPKHIAWRNNCRQALTEYAAVVKQDHYEVKGYVERLLDLLKSRKP